jgi:hypothetical protein
MSQHCSRGYPSFQEPRLLEKRLVPEADEWPVGGDEEERRSDGESIMRISSLIAQLRFLRDNYGDLECVICDGNALEPMRHPKVLMLNDGEGVGRRGLQIGDRVSVMCSSVDAS